MTTITLKDYQRNALYKIKQNFELGISSQLIVLPTGTGKTYLMAAISKEYNKKTLIIAHREELMTQAADKIKRYWPDADIGICKADRNELKHQIIIGSVQTCSKPKRLRRLKDLGFEVMIIDEAHHAASKSYRKIINALGFKGNNKLLVGVTATPERNDKLGLKDVFQKITFKKTISTMIKDGHLCPVEGRKILTETSIIGITTHAGDFAVGELSRAVNNTARNEFIVQKFIDHAPERKAIVFSVDVQHAKNLATAFNARTIKTAAVWGSMPKDDRKKVLNDFKNGELQVLTSCGVLTEGYDEETVDCIIMARPTKSRSLYIQCIGRGLRLPTNPTNTKKDCLVLDFNDKYHKLDAIMSLKSTMPEAKEIVDVGDQKKSSSIVAQNSSIVTKNKIKQISDKKINLLGGPTILWVPLDDEWSLMSDDNREIIVRPFGGGYVVDIVEGDYSRPFIEEPLPLERCKEICEDWANENWPMFYAKFDEESILKRPTLGQIEFFRKRDINYHHLNRQTASLKIRRILTHESKSRRLARLEPATEKQKDYLKILGANPDNLENLSKAQAMQTISSLKQRCY